MLPEPDQDRSTRGRRGLRRTAVRAGTVAWAAIHVLRAIRSAAALVLQAALAVVIVFEEWGWQPLAAAVAALARYAAIARIEAAIASLPPLGALVVFAAPSLLILPLKLIALWLITGGHVLAATLLFLGAKVFGTALAARLFQLTQPALMQLAWFAAAYHTLVPWKDALADWVRNSWAWRIGRLVKSRLKHRLAMAWRRARPELESLLLRLRGLLGRR